MLIVQPALYGQDFVITVWSYEYESDYDEIPLEVKEFKQLFLHT